jgi:hypothetical protein
MPISALLWVNFSGVLTICMLASRSARGVLYILHLDAIYTDLYKNRSTFRSGIWNGEIGLSGLLFGRTGMRSLVEVV